MVISYLKSWCWRDTTWINEGAETARVGGVDGLYYVLRGRRAYNNLFAVTDVKFTEVHVCNTACTKNEINFAEKHRRKHNIILCAHNNIVVVKYLAFFFSVSFSVLRARQSNRGCCLLRTFSTCSRDGGYKLGRGMRSRAEKDEEEVWEGGGVTRFARKVVYANWPIRVALYTRLFWIDLTSISWKYGNMTFYSLAWLKENFIKII